MLNFTIRPARRDDADTLLFFIKKLAEYERLSDQVYATTEKIIQYGFGDRPYFNALLAQDADGRSLGLASYFFIFSTFLCLPTLYLEDLFVLPEYRGHGIGSAFFRHIVRIANEHNCGRVEWSVLDWNDRAIGFYKALGAYPVGGWTDYRLDGAKLKTFKLD